MEVSRIALPIGVTLDRFIKSKESEYPSAVGAFSQLLRDIALAAKVVNRELNKAGLIDIMGNIGNYNAGGDEQKKLDILANTRFIRALSKGGEVCGIISEEDESFIDLSNDGKYIVAIDPLDGSSNIDVNVSVGTIFSIYKRISPEGAALTEKDFLQKGRSQISAGYILFGPSSMLVFTTGNGVNGFTYEPSLGEFVLSNTNIMCSPDGKIYSMNEGLSNIITSNYVKHYILDCKEKELTARYIGSLVADFHRNLLKGGIYLYPPTSKYTNGKLRLMFEANALAFVIEQAGGEATNGEIPIMDIDPLSIHQTTPLYIGSKNMVSNLLGFK
jgi:fructose-1,6-bisphosphatase I